MLKLFENKQTSSGTWSGLDAWDARQKPETDRLSVAIAGQELRPELLETTEAHEVLETSVAETSVAETRLTETLVGAASQPGYAQARASQPGYAQASASQPSKLQAKATQGSGQIISFCGASGGVGKTSLAINTAFELAMAGHKVALVDFDIVNPNLLAAMNQEGIVPGLAGVSRLVRQGRFGTEDLDRLMMVLNYDGVRLAVLPGLANPDCAMNQATPDRDESIEAWSKVSDELFVVLQAKFDHVVVDLPPLERHPELVRGILEKSTSSFVICGADPVAVQRFFWLNKRLSELGLSNEPQVVVNGVRDSVLGSNAKSQLAETLERVAGAEVVAFVAHDQAAFDISLREGLPLSLAKKASPARHDVSLFVRQGLLGQRTNLDWRVARHG